MAGLNKEASVFICAIFSGIVVHFVYYILTVLRKIIKHRMYAVQIEDLLFWTGTSVYLFYQIYRTSRGRIRWYFILGVILGMILFSIFLSLIREMCEKKDKDVDKTEKTD